jgi:tape measure domain-containing protein
MINIGTYLAQFKIDTGGVKESLNGITDGIGKYLKPAVIFTAVGTGLAYSIKKAMDFETIRTQLGTLFQSDKVGNALFKQLNEFSSKTHIAVQDLGTMATTLKGFGAADENNMLKTLSMLGDITHGNREQMQGLAVVYSQVAAQGKIMGNDIYQFINNGVPVYQLLSDYTGKTVGELKDMQSQGKLTFDMLEKSFEKATAKGGMFYGSIERSANTTSGKFASLKSALDNMAATVGEVFLPIVKVFLDIGIYLVRFGTFLLKYLLAPLKIFFEAIKVIFDLIIDAFAILWGAISKLGELLFGWLSPIVEYFRDLWNNLIRDILISVKWIQDMMNKALAWAGSSRRVDWVSDEDINSLKKNIDGKKVVEHQHSGSIALTGNVNTDSKYVSDLFEKFLNSEKDAAAQARSLKRMELGLTH